MDDMIAPLVESDSGVIRTLRSVDGTATRLVGSTDDVRFAFNSVSGDDIWELIWGVCEVGVAAVILNAQSMVVVSDDHLGLLPADVSGQVCRSASELRRVVEAYWADPVEVPLNEDHNRSFFALDGSRVVGWVPGQEALLAAASMDGWVEAVASASTPDLEFVGLSLSCRLWGRFDEPGRVVRSLPEGLENTFEVWAAEAWSAVLSGEGLSAVAVDDLGGFDGRFFGDEGAGLLQAFDLAGRAGQVPADEWALMAALCLHSGLVGVARDVWAAETSAAELPAEVSAQLKLALDDVLMGFVRGDLARAAGLIGGSEAEPRAEFRRCRDDFEKLASFGEVLRASGFGVSGSGLDIGDVVRGAFS